jgi:hypothetical protein
MISRLIKYILSNPLPNLVEYTTHRDISGKALWHLGTTLKYHPYRVRKISFRWTGASFDEVTKRPFPMLESLILSMEVLRYLPWGSTRSASSTTD